MAKYAIVGVSLSKTTVKTEEQFIIRVDVASWDWIKKNVATWSTLKNRFSKWSDLIGN
ncbi:hypothetical protein [Longibaculum muris]|uniref:hypothetical protein n=1 Tax=Longibaculum muris TaxID=1796628 RepID=UPI0022E7F4AC|nr:hypothetical protein [Longibaculum muris]